jgi:hypothetical protein
MIELILQMMAKLKTKTIGNVNNKLNPIHSFGDEITRK